MSPRSGEDINKMLLFECQWQKAMIILNHIMLPAYLYADFIYKNDLGVVDAQ